MAQITFTNTGGITTTGTITSAKADITGKAGHGATLLSVIDSESLTNSQISHSARFYNSNMAAGAANALLVGKEGSSKNSAYIGFYYAGAGSNDNYLRLGHYAADNQMIIKAGGNVGINTTAPSYKLDVNGDIRSQSKAYIGTGGSYIQYNSTNQSIEFCV